MVRTNMIKNCPVTTADIEIADKIFGPDLPTLKGKTVRRQPDRGNVITCMYLRIRELNHKVTLGADVMFVDRIPFFISVSRGIKFITVEYIPRRTKKLLGGALKIVEFYRARGFQVKTA